MKVAVVVAVAVLAAFPADAAARADARDRTLPRAVAATGVGTTVTVRYSERLARAVAPHGVVVHVNGRRVKAVRARIAGERLTIKLERAVWRDDVVTLVRARVFDTSRNPAADRPLAVEAKTSRAGCSLTLVPPPWKPRLYEGPTDYAQSLRSRGRLRVAAVFVEFPDATAPASSGDAYAATFPGLAAWYHVASFGRLSVEATPATGWVRMPLPWRDYERHLGTVRASELVRDALRAADPVTDFRGIETVLIIVPPDARFSDSYAIFARPQDDFATEEGRIRFGTWARLGDPLAAEVLAHEVGHFLGLPDLYRHTPRGFNWAGQWDPMSAYRFRGGLTGWHRWKLGWLDPWQLRCLDEGSLEQTLSPVARAGGMKAIVVRTESPYVAWVVENRQPVEHDARLCSHGVLLYRVDAAPQGGPPILVRRAENRPDRCGIADGAPLGVAPDQPATYEGDGLRVEVLGFDSNGDARVRVTKL